MLIITPTPKTNPHQTNRSEGWPNILLLVSPPEIHAQNLIGMLECVLVGFRRYPFE